MPALTSSACGKFILCGEHAVVHGQPAIALPLSSRRINLRAEPLILGPSGKIVLSFPSLGLDAEINDLPENHPIYHAVFETLKVLGITQKPSCKLHFNANLPIGSGLGSSAAMAVATIRGLSAFLGHPLDEQTVNQLAYECEKQVHINPSGIDNTVISYEKPLFFQRGKEPEFIQTAKDLHFILADTGIQKSTRENVAGLAKFREENPDFVKPRLEEIGNLARTARKALLSGDDILLAHCVNRNQKLLRDLELSCPELEQLISMAMDAGALAAKLTGGGKGGHMLALVEADKSNIVLERMTQKGALNAFITIVKGN